MLLNPTFKYTSTLALAWLAFAAPRGHKADAAESATPVAVAHPETESESPSYAFSGSITAQRHAVLSPRVAGLVQTADAESGYVAKSGEALVQLDATLAEIELRQMEANLERAKAESDDAQRRLAEATELGDSNFPRTERESRQTASRLAAVAVRQAEAEVERQREQVLRHAVIAPFDGVVARKYAEIGEWVQTGDAVIELVGLDTLRLEAQIPQERLDVARRTQTVEIRIAGDNGPPILGRLEAIAPSIDPGTRTFAARVAIDNPPARIKPGMSALATFRPPADESALMIARDAIIRSAEGETLVWLAQESDGSLRAVRRPVELGVTRGDRIQALAGLAANDQVVVRGNESLREGQLIRIVGAPPAQTSTAD